MKSYLLTASLLLMSTCWMTGEESKSDATQESSTVELFTLKDGRTMAGSYDPDTKQLKLVNRKTGKPMGSMSVSAESIADRKPLVITPPAATPSAAPGCHGEWIESLEDAVAASKQTGRPILVDFTGSDWCGWCIKLHKEVFDTPEFKEWAAQNAVLMVADFPHQKAQSATVKKQNADLATKYGIQGFPTIVVIDATGKKLAEQGYQEGGPKAWTTSLASLTKFPH